MDCPGNVKRVGYLVSYDPLDGSLPIVVTGMLWVTSGRWVWKRVSEDKCRSGTRQPRNSVVVQDYIDELRHLGYSEEMLHICYSDWRALNDSMTSISLRGIDYSAHVRSVGHIDCRVIELHIITSQRRNGDSYADLAKAVYRALVRHRGVISLVDIRSAVKRTIRIAALVAPNHAAGISRAVNEALTQYRGHDA